MVSLVILHVGTELLGVAATLSEALSPISVKLSHDRIFPYHFLFIVQLSYCLQFDVMYYGY
jgi:hypothetical protein